LHTSSLTSSILRARKKKTLCARVPRGFTSCMRGASSIHNKQTLKARIFLSFSF